MGAVITSSHSGVSQRLGIDTHMEMGAPVQSQKGGSFSDPPLTGAGITHLLRGSRRPTVARGTKPARANIYCHTSLVQFGGDLLTPAWVRSYVTLRVEGT